MPPYIERIAENFKLAEGPHWSEETQSLYFVDIPGHSINRYVPDTKQLTTASTGAHVSLIIPVKDQKNTFIISIEKELKVITWDGDSDTFSVKKTIESGSNLKFNDGKCDPKGRLWTGTLSMNEGDGSLYVVEKDKIRKVEDKIFISNGLAFNTDLKKMYYIDSMKKTIDEFEYDVEVGTVKNRHAIFSLEKHDIPGGPDGMAIDVDGNLWVAIFMGSRVIQIDPRKPETLLYTLSLPAKQVTSVAFGGKYLDELYVTTGRASHSGEELLPPIDGAIYKVTGLGTRGIRAENFVL